MQSHLHGISAHVSGGTSDHYRVAAFRQSILEEHLPGGNRDNRRRSRFKVVQGLGFWADHSSQCDGEFRLGIAELRIGYTVDSIANCKLAHIGTHRLNKS